MSYIRRFKLAFMKKQNKNQSYYIYDNFVFIFVLKIINFLIKLIDWYFQQIQQLFINLEHNIELILVNK